MELIDSVNSALLDLSTTTNQDHISGYTEDNLAANYSVPEVGQLTVFTSVT